MGRMATLLDEGSNLRIHLGGWERLGALRGDLVISRTQVASMRVVDDVVQEMRGIRAPGYGFPGHAAIGTWRGHGYKDFVAVYWKQRRGVVISLTGADYDRVIVSTGATVELPQRIAPAV